MSHRFTPAKQAKLAKLDQLNLPDNLDSNATGDAMVLIDDPSNPGTNIWSIAPAPAGPVATLESVNDVSLDSAQYGQALKYHDGTARRFINEGDTTFLNIAALASGVSGSSISILFVDGADAETYAGDTLTITRTWAGGVDAATLAAAINAIGGVGVTCTDSGGSFTAIPANGNLSGGQDAPYWFNDEDLQGGGGGGGANALNDLADVDTAGAGNGEVLTSNGAGGYTFEVVAGGGGASDLNGLSDVNTGGASAGQVLKFADAVAAVLNVTDASGAQLTITGAGSYSGTAGDDITVNFAVGGDAVAWDDSTPETPILTLTRADWTATSASDFTGNEGPAAGHIVFSDSSSNPGDEFDAGEPADGQKPTGGVDEQWAPQNDLEGGGGGASDLGGLSDWTVDDRSAEANTDAVGVNLSEGGAVKEGQILRAHHVSPGDDSTLLRFVAEFPESVPYIRPDAVGSSYPITGAEDGLALATAFQLGVGEILADLVIVSAAVAGVHMLLPETRTAPGAQEVGRQFTIKNIGAGILSIYAQQSGDSLEGVAEAGAGESIHELDSMQSITVVLASASVGGASSWYIK